MDRDAIAEQRAVIYQRRNAALADALVEYGRHKDGCRVYVVGTVRAQPADCTCGLATMLHPLARFQDGDVVR